MLKGFQVIYFSVVIKIDRYQGFTVEYAQMTPFLVNFKKMIYKFFFFLVLSQFLFFYNWKNLSSLINFDRRIIFLHIKILRHCCDRERKKRVNSLEYNDLIINNNNKRY